jgi:hypothetical protein
LLDALTKEQTMKTASTARCSLSIVTSLICLFGCTLEQANVSEDSSAQTTAQLELQPCGTELTSFDGTAVYSNGSQTETGNSCDGSWEYGYKYQCVELVQRHFKTKWGIRWYGNANQQLANAPRDKVDVHENGGPVGPVPGDLIAFNKAGHSWGHVALISEVTPTTVTIVEQNVKSSFRRTLPRTGNSVGAGWTDWYVMGWAHAKANTSAPSPRPEVPERVIEVTSPQFVRSGWWGQATDSARGTYYWTNSAPSFDGSRVEWHLGVTTSGPYELFAFIPAHNATTRSGLYQVTSQSTSAVRVNQLSYSDQWVSLGTHFLDAARDNYVTLTDDTDECKKCTKVSAAALKVVKR